MPQTTRLFSALQLTAWLRQDVTVAQAGEAEKVVWGWLAPILKVEDRPDVVSVALYSAALELGGIAFSNPEGLSSYELETEKTVYSSERRDEILRILAAQNNTTAPGLTPAAPVGSFPAACAYPDPARRFSYFRW